MRAGWIVTVSGFVFLLLMLVDAGSLWARATSGGSRGSRSLSAPVRPAPAPATPAAPTRSATPENAPRPGFFGSVMSGIAGFALGGLLGSLLFGSGAGGGVGLLEVMLLAGAALLAYRMMRTRQPEPVPAAASAVADDDAGAATAVVPATDADLARGLAYIRGMDPGFDPDAFVAWATRVFIDVQAAITRRDLTAVSDRLTPQEYARLQAQCDRLRAAGQTNRVERIEVRRTALSEAWQESGQDWATVYVAASLADYTVDDTSGAVVDGSRTPEDIEEYWTFTRPVGPRPWRLSAIQTGS
jgi:predicted lipid-binding transport protein (Tim44 family)